MLLIARRYLLSKKSHSVVNIISLVSLFSLLIPVAAVILLLSIFNGFGSLVSTTDQAIEADLTISLRQGRLFNEADIDSLSIAQTRDVESFSYITEQLLLVEHKAASRLLTFRGIEENYTSVIPIESMLYAGRFEVRLGDLERVVLGGVVAAELGIRNLFDIDLTLHSLKTGRLQSMLPIPMGESREARLSGVIMADEESEAKYGYASRRLINSIISREGVLSKVVVKLTEGADAMRVKAELQSRVGDRFKVESREELNPALYEIIQFEKLGVLMICSLVMILAAFSLAGALSMLIIEKREDTLTLRAMGATREMIRRIFQLEGALLSGVAILLGVALGVALSLIQQHFGFVQMPISTIYGTAYPVELQLLDVVSVFAIATAISWVICLIVVNIMVRETDARVERH